MWPLPRQLVPCLACSVLACGGRQPPVVAAPAPAVVCRVVTRTAPARDTIVVGVPGAVDTANVTHPETEPERFVFGIAADPARRSCTGDPLPAGMALYHLDTTSPDRIVAQPIARGPVIVFRIAPAADPRDLLDQGADVVVTDDPAAIDYATRRDGYEVAPLPWAWTYVLLGPAPVAVEGVAPLDSLLAAGAIHGDVEPATPPFWWTNLPPCTVADFAARTPAARLAYSTSDPVARDLAARLVSLAATRRVSLVPGSVALPLAPAEFDSALDARAFAAYIAALPVRASDTCAPFPDLGITPLVAARSHVIARRGAVTIDVDWYGTPYFVVTP